MSVEICKYAIPLKCLPLETKKEEKPTACKTSVIWVKILNWLSEDELSSKNSSNVCHLFRTINVMRKVNAEYAAGRTFSFPSLMPADPFLQGEFSRLAMANQLPTFRLFQATGMTGKDGMLMHKDLILNDFYKAIQLVSHEQFESALTRYFDVIKKSILSPSSWMGAVPPELGNMSNTTFSPFAQKLVLQPNVECIIRGDLHGDIHSLVAFIKELQRSGYTDPNDPLKFIKPFNLIFLGDYVDRGLWGLEVIYLLMLLKIKNPEQVFLIRGNHEDPEMADKLGFYQEYSAKFGEEDPEKRNYSNLTAFYNSLPVVLYVGSGTEKKLSFVQCCHGGMEWGYNPQNFLNQDLKSFESIETFNRLSECVNFPNTDIINHCKGHKSLKTLETYVYDFSAQTPKKPCPIGFMWHEFNVPPTEITNFYQERGVFSCSQAFTQEIFAAANHGKNSLEAAIRAHQHAPNNPLMKLLLNANGCTKLWNAHQPRNIVLEKNDIVTLLLTPDSDSGLSESKLAGFTYDTTLHLVTAAQFEDWKCTVTNNEIY